MQGGSTGDAKVVLRVPTPTEDVSSSVTNGDFAPSCDHPDSTGSSVSTFLQSSSCTASYITADGDYSLVTFHGDNDLRVSVNDVVSIRCCTGANASSRDLWMLIDSTYYKCSGGLHGITHQEVCNSGQWRDTTVTVDGNFVGLKGTGVSPGGGGDIGLGQMKINGYLIYNGSTYKTGINQIQYSIQLFHQLKKTTPMLTQAMTNL